MARFLPKHGGYGTPEYRAWQHIKSRCFNSACKSFTHYGARGITMCDHWRDSFEAFLADVGPKPSPFHSIDRINNDGDYEPGNCRWATRSEQLNNRRTNRRIEVDGQMLTVSEAAKLKRLSRGAIYSRIHGGADPQTAFNLVLQKGL